MSAQKSTCSRTKLELCMSVENTETQRSAVACVCHIEFNKLYVFTRPVLVHINSNVNLTIH